MGGYTDRWTDTDGYTDRWTDTDWYTDRQQDDLISFFSFFQNKEIRLKTNGTTISKDAGEAWEPSSKDALFSLFRI
jgi:hypothetical protein